MAPEPSRLQDSFQPNREATNRPLCNTEKPSASYLLHMESGSASTPSGCNDLGVDRNNSLCIPSDSSDPAGSPKTQEIALMPHDPDHTPLAAPDVVPEAHVDAGGESADSANEARPDSHIGGSSSSEADEPDNQVDYMAHFIRSYTAAGLSQSAAKIAGEARRPATRKTQAI